MPLGSSYSTGKTAGAGSGRSLIVRLVLDVRSVKDYETFLRVKSLPVYSFTGREAWFPDEYASRLGVDVRPSRIVDYAPPEWAFDYQRDISRMVIKKRKFAVFADCGLGKTIILLEFAIHARLVLPRTKNVLIVSPLMVVQQTITEAKKFYGDDFPIEFVPAAKLSEWIMTPTNKIGITNYDALNDETPQGCLGALGLDESSMLKSMYGKWGQKCIDLGRGLEWKLCLTGTPAPNDRIEYGNHAVFLDQFPTLNAFLARYFINRGQTDNRWELKAHALEAFYRSLSHWSIFLTNPATYGWKDNCGSIPPINVHIHDVNLTAEQVKTVGKETGELFPSRFGGITSRATLARIAKGTYRGEVVETLKPAYIKDLAATWPDESTIIWCLYNDEQDGLARLFPECANIDGSTPHEKRVELIDDFKAGRRKVLISKAKILGFGLNLQIATRQVFSSLQDSYESYYQAVKRSNRYGSIKPLNVHVPVTEIEYPMVENVLRKARMVQQDTEMQERIFRDASA